MNRTLLTASELANRIHFSSTYINHALKDTIFLQGQHYIRPFGGRKIFYIWEEVEKEGVRKKSVKKSDHPGLSEVRVMTLELNSSNGAVLDFVGALLGADVTRNQLRLPFVKMIEHETQGVDLAARADETLDLELLYFSVDDAVDLVEFSKKADEKSNPYLDQSKRTLSIEAPNHMEVWFVKA